MKQHKLSKKCINITALGLAVVLLCLAVLGQPAAVMAKETLPGVEVVVDQNSNYNPYVILEVVPDRENAALGYLVGGEEPIHNGKALTDMPLRMERAGYLGHYDTVSGNYASIFGEGEDKIVSFTSPYTEYDTVSDPNVKKSMDLRGEFIEDEDGEYWAKYLEEQYKLYDEATDEEKLKPQYQRFSEFEKADTGTYGITVSKVEVPSNRVTKITDAIGGTPIDYNSSYKFELTPDADGLALGLDLSKFTEGTLIFRGDGSGENYTYYGRIEKLEAVKTLQEEPITEELTTEEATTEETTEPTTEEPTTEKPSEPTTEKPSEPTTEKPSEPATEKPSEPATEKPSEPATEKPSEPAAGKPTEPETVTATKVPMSGKSAQTASSQSASYIKYSGMASPKEAPPEKATADNATEETLPDKVPPKEVPPETTTEENSTAEKTTEESSAEDDTSEDETSTEETSTEELSTEELSTEDIITDRLDLVGSLYYIQTTDNKKVVLRDEDVIPDTTVLTALTDDELGLYQAADFTMNLSGGDYYISSAIYYGEDAHAFKPVVRYDLLTEENSGDNYQGLASDHFVKMEDSKTEYYYKPVFKGDTRDLTSLRWESKKDAPVWETFYYSGGFTNHEWFKKSVFDRTQEQLDKQDMVIDVKTILMSELEQYDLSKVGMVYFAGGTKAYPTDITSSKARKVMEEIIKNRLPVVYNYSAIQKEKENPNMAKLGKLLMQESLEGFDLDNLEKNWKDEAFWTKTANNMKKADSDEMFGHVYQSIYVFDDVHGKTATPFVNVDFRKPFQQSKIEYGYSDVANEIEHENFFRAMENKDKIDTTISQAAALRYIINFASQRNVIKSEISVLEIEPCNTFNYSAAQLKQVRIPGGKNIRTVGKLTLETLTKQKIAEDWATQFKGREDQIHLKQTYTGEFIGKIEDLNENYDLIYIGLDTTTMDTVMENKSGSWVKTNQTLYNDSSLNNLVYTHTGDYIITDYDYLHGLLYPNNVAAEPSDPDYNKYRMSGNDITPDKLRDLQQFMEAGYPVIFADDFYIKTGDDSWAVNTKKIDRASYLYQLADYAIVKGYFGKNVNIDSNIKNSSEQGEKKVLAQYLNLSKLAVTATSVPTPYVEGNASKYLTAENGEYYLKYEVALRNDSASSIVDTNYHCELYIDTSVDGRFSEEEKVGGLNISELRDGNWIPVGLNGEGHFTLTAGKNYRIVRQVPTGYVGVLPWKIVFRQNDDKKEDSLIRKSLLGYCAVPVNKANQQPIKVLQITSGEGNTNLDLTSGEVQKLLDKVQDFNIQIEKISANAFIALNPKPSSGSDIAAYYQYLNGYDMLITGFADVYAFNGTDAKQKVKQEEAAARAIRKYISDGKSVLFTHDTTSFSNNPSSTLWGEAFNRYIRDIVGMDRYGIMKGLNEIEINTVYDTPWKAGTNPEDGSILKTKQGYSDANLVRYEVGNLYSYSSRASLYTKKEGQYPGQKMNVSSVNEGQITRYPFAIPDNFQVANTHFQYYQLNLDTNSKDSILDDDIVVWYCISDVDGQGTDDFYQATPNNVRNEYYIYNKGNVTYSGVGHKPVATSGGDLFELKLFINTMVAAYNSGIHPPKIVFKENAGDTAAIIQHIYMPFDSAISAGGSFLEEKAKLYFDISDTSLVQGSKQLKGRYYMEVDPGAGGVKTSVNGKDVFLKELAPEQIVSLTNTRTGTVPGGDRSSLENDSRYELVLNANKLNLPEKDSINIYIGAKTTYRLNGVETTTEEGYFRLGIIRTGLFDLE